MEQNEITRQIHQEQEQQQQQQQLNLKNITTLKNK